MEKSIYDMTHYRIRDLVPFGDESEDPVGVLAGSPENKNWWIGIDSMDEVIPPEPGPHGAVDIGGRTYGTTRIGNQEWLTENLDWVFPGLEFKDASNPLIPPESYYSAPVVQAAYYQYNEEEYGQSGKRYGLLYSGAAITYLQGHLEEFGLADGWRVPRANDFEDLIHYAGYDGQKLRSSEWNGTDEYGYNALPGGTCLAYVGEMEFYYMDYLVHYGGYLRGSGSAPMMSALYLDGNSIALYDIPYGNCRYIRLVRDVPRPSSGKYFGKRICAERLVVTGPQGKIPAVNMPSCISDCSYVEIVPILPSYGIIGKVYCLRQDGQPDKFYRWVEEAGASPGSPKTGSFVPIACNYTMEPGKGTIVSDGDESRYTRQIDLNIGTPGEPDENVLTSNVAEGIAHSKSGIGDAGGEFAYDAISGFGGTFHAPSLTVTSTGHVTGVGSEEITFPATAATTDGVEKVTGLVEIAVPSDEPDSPESSHIQPISGTSSPGTTVPSTDGYVYVASADHVHSASTIAFANLRNSSGTFEIGYNMSSGVTLDMSSILHALPPSNAPTEGMMLQSGTGSTTSWTSTPTTNRHYTSTGHSYVVVGTGTSLITNQLSPFKVMEDTLYSVDVVVKVKITEGIGANIPGNVPKCYVCVLDIGGVTRTFNIPGSYTFNLPYILNLNCLFKAGQSSASDHMVNVDVKATLDDNIFSACCELAEASELI